MKWVSYIDIQFELITILNGPTPASFIIYFWSFLTNMITIFTSKICEKCPFSIRCRDLNPCPLEHESPSITTRKDLFHRGVILYSGIGKVLQFPCIKSCDLFKRIRVRYFLIEKLSTLKCIYYFRWQYHKSILHYLG